MKVPEILNYKQSDDIVLEINKSNLDDLLFLTLKMHEFNGTKLEMFHADMKRQKDSGDDFLRTIDESSNGDKSSEDSNKEEKFNIFLMYFNILAKLGQIGMTHSAKASTLFANIVSKVEIEFV